jgi:hypothetical protein
MPAVGQMLRCASHSLSVQEIARAEAVARAALPSSVRLVATGACWNVDFARVELDTPTVVTPERVKQNWTVWCQRDESTWACEPPEFKQAILVTLPVGNKTRRVELHFDKLTSLPRARALAERTLALYADPTSRVPTCGNGDVENPPSDPHRDTASFARADPIRVTVSRRDSTDSVELEDVYREFEFRAASEDPELQQVTYWLDVIVVT